MSIEQKQIHDIIGSYNRFDIFRLTVDRRANQPITTIGEESIRDESVAAPPEDARSTQEQKGRQQPWNKQAAERISSK
jgi:hypothetical protein